MDRYDYSKHSPLAHDTTESGQKPPRAHSPSFRILKVKHGTKDDTIECNLLVRGIPPDPKDTITPAYDALSYNWGPQGGDFFVRVLVNSDAYKIPIRRNLNAALRQVRREDRDIFLWVDALCMDQNDKEEKSAQIPLMQLIYNRAESVQVWLGEAKDNSDCAMDFVSQCLDLDKFDKLVKDPFFSDDWAALSSLMRRPWFNRRWIIQEIALAKSASVLCGAKSVDWQDFATVISMISERQSELRQLFRASSTHRNHPDFLGDLSELGAIRLADLSDNLFRKAEGGRIMERLFSLEALMASLTAFEASDPHDVLYAILWLASDAVPKTKGAYNSNAPEVYYGPATPVGITSSPVQMTHEPPSVAGASTREPFDNNFLDPISGLSPGRPIGRQRSRSDLIRTSSGGGLTVIPRVELNGTEQQTNFATPGRHTNSGSDHSKEDIPPHGETKNAAATAAQGPSRPVSHSRHNSNASQGPDSHLLRPRLSISTTSSMSGDHTAEERAGYGFKHALRNKYIIVDYERSVFEVCQDFLAFTVKRSASLDMLCIPWAPNDDSLPSWIPRLKGGAFAPTVTGIHRRVNADPLAGRSGHPGLSPKMYKASKGYPADWQFKAGDGRSLIAKGFVLDKVQEKTAPAAGGTIPLQWLEAGGWMNHSEPPPDLFWRTLVGNRDATGRLPSAFWKKTCQEAFNCRPIGGDINTTDILYDCSSFVEAFLKRVQRMVWSRKLVTLERLARKHNVKLLGLAPEKTKKGDLICILYGCSVPVVLRKMIDNEPAVKRKRCSESDCPSHSRFAQAIHSIHYQFIGECYVHGMMEGEALDVKNVHKLKEEYFELR